LKDNEKVVTQGAYGLSDGTKIKVVQGERRRMRLKRAEKNEPGKMRSRVPKLEGRDIMEPFQPKILSSFRSDISLASTSTERIYAAPKGADEKR